MFSFNFLRDPRFFQPSVDPKDHYALGFRDGLEVDLHFSYLTLDKLMEEYIPFREFALGGNFGDPVVMYKESDEPWSSAKLSQIEGLLELEDSD